MEKTQNKQLTLGSLFSGSGGFELGGILAGIKPIWNSDIEPFAIRVTTKRLLGVKHYGDVSSLSGAELEPVDIVTFGSPCQGLSQAGKRLGLDDARSGLYIEAIRICKEMLDATNREYPKFCVFENVPGLYSCNKGEDFKACMDMMQELGFIPDISVLDSQHMGVPQRRKRVYITWINVDYILKKRTNISDSITLQLLTELLLLNLEELLGVLGTDQKKSDVQERSRFADGVKRRIKLFSLQKEDRLQMLQRNLEEIKATCSNARTDSALSPGEDLTVGCISTVEDIRYSDLKKECQSMSIGQLLRISLEESLLLMNESTILTQTKETTIQRISFYLEALLNTLELTIRLTNLLERMPMYLNYYEWVLSSLTKIRGNIYAGLKYSKSTGNMEWHDLFRVYEQKFSRMSDYFEQYFRTRCGQEILSFSESVQRNFEQGFRSWQGAAGGTEESTGASGICLNDQGGERMDVTEGVTSTLRAEAHHPPVVTEAAGFCTEHSKDSRGIGYEEETAPTLRAGTVPAAVYENHGQDTRFTGPLEIAPTVLSTYGTGGNNQPFVVEDQPKTFDVRLTSEGTRNARSNVYETETSRTIDTGGNAPDANQGGVAICEKVSGDAKAYGIGKPAFTSGEKAGFNFAVNEELSPTLQASGPDAVAQPEQKAFGICGKYSHSMMSDNPNSGFYEAETARTIDTSNQCPAKNQGGVVVVEGNGSRPSHKGNGYSESETMYTLNTTEQHKVAYGIDRASYNMGRNAQFGMVIDEEVEPTLVAKGAGAVGQPVYHSSKNSYHTHFSDSDATDTLVATDYKDPPTVSEEPYYIVRRLTPTECARLQGFPDWWCMGLETEEPTEEDIAFWTEVFETHRKVMGTSSKPKSRNQIIKWLKNPHSDSAEYKLWGNGVSLPVVYYVLSGIVYYSQVKELYTP